ncbi:MAG: hypothetical protein H6Q73_3596 [Firmicutes bacterium]|nr:hypothetical protein [Bacillota bacterium]
MRQNIKNRIIGGKKKAAWFVDYVFAKKKLSLKEFQEIFHAYMCSKFLLESSEIKTDNFYEICQISVEKVSKLPKGALDAAEAASKCGGATSAMNKKVLFILAVNQEFKIAITAEESVQIESFNQLTELVYEKLYVKG